MKDHRKFELTMKKEEKNLNDTLFNEIISTYSNPNHLMHKKMKHVLKYVQPGNALIDVGCGIGEFLVRLQDRFHTLVGVDISQPEIEFAKKRLGNSSNVFLHCGKLESFHFPDEHFNVCLCPDVLEHVPTLFPLLQEIYRILRTHGDLIVTVPNWYDIIVSKILNKNPQHVNTFTPWHWMAILKKAGFKIRFYRAIDFPLISSEFLSKKIPILGMCILIVAFK
ncbi:MAG: class I SAM-dependent methyltransferase [Thermodesulfobacteriota bacterium]